MSGGKSACGSYARAIERHWSTLRDGPVVLSPREWLLISDWHARGVPLQIVLEALSEAAERAKASPRRRARRAPRSLAAVAAAVEESWSAVVDGRLRENGGGPDSGARARVDLEAWRRRIDAEPAGSTLRELLVDALRRVEAGEAAAAVDPDLDARLSATVPPALWERARRLAEEELAPFRERMSAQAYGETLERVARWRLREELRLPLSLGPRG